MRTEEVARWQEALADTTPFELLILSSLYALEHLVPMGMCSPVRRDEAMSAEEGAWHAINDILLWKLGMARPEDLRLEMIRLAFRGCLLRKRATKALLTAVSCS